MVDAGFDAQTAVDGDHAIRSAAALQPDLIILDIYVPEAEGAIRFASEYRRRVRGEDRAPIIAMSARSNLDSFAQQVGASGTLRKPFDNDELVSLARKLLAGSAGDDESAGKASA
jgi:DNA-binding response OmpR family regulator